MMIEAKKEGDFIPTTIQNSSLKSWLKSLKPSTDVRPMWLWIQTLVPEIWQVIAAMTCPQQSFNGLVFTGKLKPENTI